MSDQQPPAGTPEYLDSGSGSSLSPLPPDQETTGRRSRRTAWVVGGGLVGALALGAGAWAAVSFFAQGAQPAEALPSTTIAYASIDLDPSGSQKIDAFRTLNKFPAFKDQVGVHSVDDVRQKLGDELVKGLGCDGLTFADDIDPWLGNRAAVALVDAGNPDPDPVSVVQVSDDGKAEDALKKLVACGGSQGDVFYDVHDGWAVFAGSQKIVDTVVSDTGDASLADDSTYQKWTDAVGDSGVVNLYAAPAAGDQLAARLDSLQQDLGDLGAGLSGGLTQSAIPSGSDAYSSSMTIADGDHGAVGTILKNFKGAAATIRFTGDGFELATASDPGLSQSGSAGDQAGAVVQDLPDDTAAAIGIALEPGWVMQVADRIASVTGSTSGHDLLDQLGEQSGLDLPSDLETLLGSSTAVSISHDFDAEKAAMSDDGSGVPVAVTVKGDAGSIEKVLAKLRGQDPSTTTALGSDSSGDLVVIGPAAAYRQQILAGGHLGDSDAFRSVVPQADHAGIVVFVDLDAVQKMVGQLAAGDEQVTDNLAPLQAFGFSGWVDDDDVARTSLKISTD